MRQRDRQVGVKQSNRGIKLKERQSEDRRRGHAVCQQPKGQLLVPQKPIARKRIGRRQRNADGNHCVQRYIDDRVEIAPIPAWIRENHPIVVDGERLRKQAKARQDFARVLKLIATSQ